MVLDLVKKMFRVLAMSKKIFKFYKGVVTFLQRCGYFFLYVYSYDFVFNDSYFSFLLFSGNKK